jgi:hypothetical protein
MPLFYLKWIIFFFLLFMGSDQKPKLDSYSIFHDQVMTQENWINKDNNPSIGNRIDVVIRVMSKSHIEEIYLSTIPVFRVLQNVNNTLVRNTVDYAFKMISLGLKAPSIDLKPLNSRVWYGWIVSLLVVLTWVYPGFCLWAIAEKVDATHRWMAWIPILNLTLVCRIGEISQLWVLLFLIFSYFHSLLGLGVVLFLLLQIPKALGIMDPSRFLIIIPILNLVYLGWLAFRKEETRIKKFIADDDKMREWAKTCPSCGKKNRWVAFDICKNCGQDIQSVQYTKITGKESL